MHQVSLKGMLEVTACCGLVFTMWPSGDMVAYGLCFAVLSLWSLRASRWTIRWLLVNWLGAISAVCFGFACAEHAILAVAPGTAASDYWLVSGLGFIVWGILAGINGIPFFVEALCNGNANPTHPALRRDNAA